MSLSNKLITILIFLNIFTLIFWGFNPGKSMWSDIIWLLDLFSIPFIATKVITLRETKKQ